ncbi:MAG TPA: hypothetical protein VII75_02745 [Thermoanaerobaculia bacterium]|nr:hypothetical protein [Thermoanaerobaculia bacterium]
MATFVSPAINRHVGGWNQNPTWEHFSSLVQATTDGIAAQNRTVRIHHTKAALYAAIGSIESFLNTTMHGELKAQGLDDHAIRERVRKGSFAQKLKKWPTELAGEKIQTPDPTLTAIFDWQKLRDEVTHPKIDHSLYDQLAAVRLETMRVSVAEFIVCLLEARHEIYPWWLLGWNFTKGPEHNEPVLLNSQQFLFALAHLGFNIPVPAAGPMQQWEEHFMTSIDGYRAIDEALQKIDYCQPRNPRFRFAPRLCRKWRDPTHTATCGVQ